MTVAQFCGVSIFELRATEAEEVLYVCARLMSRTGSDDAAESNEGPRRVRRFADQVDWFD